mgnify:CR=1 FL=1
MRFTEINDWKFIFSFLFFNPLWVLMCNHKDGNNINNRAVSKEKKSNSQTSLVHVNHVNFAQNMAAVI